MYFFLPFSPVSIAITMISYDEIFCIQTMNTFEIQLTKCAWTWHFILIDLSKCVETIARVYCRKLPWHSCCCNIEVKKKKLTMPIIEFIVERKIWRKTIMFMVTKFSHLMKSSIFHLTFFAIAISHLNTFPCVECCCRTRKKSRIDDGKYDLKKCFSFLIVFHHKNAILLWLCSCVTEIAGWIKYSQTWTVFYRTNSIAFNGYICSQINQIKTHDLFHCKRIEKKKEKRTKWKCGPVKRALLFSNLLNLNLMGIGSQKLVYRCQDRKIR